MRLYVDDQRIAPEGWVLARTLDEAIEHLRQGAVEAMSLDYDLGGNDVTGLDVLNWLESAVAAGRLSLPTLSAHSGSVLGRRRLETHIDWLRQRFG